MHVKTTTIHEQRLEADLDEMDLRGIITQFLAAREGFVIDPRGTSISVCFRKEDRGTAGFKDVCHVTMVNKLPAAGEEKKIETTDN